MNLYLIFALMIFFPFKVNAFFDAKSHIKTDPCHSFEGTTRTSYKIFLENEPTDISYMYPFYLTAESGVTPTIHTTIAVSYQSGAQALTDRHGTAVSDIGEHIGLFIEFDDNSEEEITNDPLTLVLLANQTDIYGGRVFYRLKNEKSIYGNVTTSVTSRFSIDCVNP